MHRAARKVVELMRAMADDRQPVWWAWAGRVALAGVIAIAPTAAAAVGAIWYLIDTSLGGYGEALRQIDGRLKELHAAMGRLDGRMAAFDQRIVEAILQRRNIRFVVEGDIRPFVRQLDERWVGSRTICG